MPINRKALGQIIYNHILHVAIHQFNKTFKSFLAPVDDESRYALCEHERLGPLIKIYNFDYCHK
jgi:hypothetical protein